MPGRCGVRLLSSPRRWSRSGPRGPQREGGGCGFGGRCGALDNKPPGRPNPRTAFLTLVSDAAFLTPESSVGQLLGVPPWSAPRGEALAGTGAGSGVGKGLPPRGGPWRGKPTTPAGLCRQSQGLWPFANATHWRRRSPAPGVASGDGKGSEVASLKMRGGNVPGRGKMGILAASTLRRVFGPCHGGQVYWRDFGVSRL